MSPTIQRERALLYNLSASTDKGARIRRILTGLGIQVIDIKPEQLGQTLGHCAGISGYGPTGGSYEGEPFIEDVLIMAALSDEKINQLLAQIRQSGTGSVSLMAVVTEHNRSWPLVRLFTELRSERQVMAAWFSLQQSVKMAEKLEASGARPVADDSPGMTFESALAAARNILQSEEPPDPAVIRQADQDLKSFL